MSALTFTSANLATMTLDDCQSWYSQGVVSQDQYEAYRWVWATMPCHEGYHHCGGWLDTPADPVVLAIGNEIRGATSA